MFVKPAERLAARVVLTATTVALLGHTPLAGAQTETSRWQPLRGAATLRELVSGATAEIELTPGVYATGVYRADGTGTIEAWGEQFERTWEVVDDEVVCYASFTERNCFTYERSLDVAGKYRSRNVETGETFLFTVSTTVPRQFSREEPPGSEGGPGAPSAADIAAELSNPNTNLGTLTLNFDYIAFEGDLPGANDRSAQRTTFQPSLPYALSPTTNLFVRPAVPVIISQDVPDRGGGFESEGIDLGDISFDASIARTFAASGTVLGGGVVGTLPTATDDSLGLDQWLLGPEAFAAIVRPWGVVGLLVTHQWDVAGEDDFDTSITGGQYFYAYNLGDGWQINASPTFSYNHEADNDNDWTFPLAVGVAKTTILGGRPWRFSLQYWHYVESPDLFGPDWQVRFSIAPVVALPW